MIRKRFKKSYEPMIPEAHIYFTFVPHQFQLPKCCRLSYQPAKTEFQPGTPFLFWPGQDTVPSHCSCYSVWGYNSHAIFYNVIYSFIWSLCHEWVSLLSYLQLLTCSKYPKISFHTSLKLLIIESFMSNLRDYNHTISYLCGRMSKLLQLTGITE